MVFVRDLFSAPILAPSLMLAMLALCFMVGAGLRPRWGLQWVAGAMALAALRGLGTAAGLGPLAGPGVSAVLFTVLVLQCVGPLKPVSGSSHPLVAASLLLNPVLVVGLGADRAGHHRPGRAGRHHGPHAHGAADRDRPAPRGRGRAAPAHGPPRAARAPAHR